jgi:hypothetical protein
MVQWYYTNRQEKQSDNYIACCLHSPNHGLVSHFPADDIGAGTDIPSYHKLPLLAKQEMLTYFGCLFTEHAGTQN